MRRAFYVLPTSEKPVPGLDDCVVVSRTATHLYLLAPVDPHSGLEAAGAIRAGAQLSEAPAAVAAHFTCKRVRRTEVPPMVTTPAARRRSARAAAAIATSSAAVHRDIMVPVCDILPDDEDLGEPPMLRMVFAGDDPNDYLGG